MSTKIVPLMLVAGALTACVAGRHLRFDHTPSEPPADSRGETVAVTVKDKRAYVLSHDKSASYVGHYRGRYAMPYDVTTYNEVPLSQRIADDLREELRNLGFQLSDAGKQIHVTIRDWNFDAYNDGKFWYELHIAVTGPDGDSLAESDLEDRIVIEGTALKRARGGFEREMPEIYARIINAVIRGNPPIRNALSS